MIRAFHDTHLPGLEAALPSGVESRPFEPAGADWEQLRGRISSQADALFIRTVTRITPEAFPELESPGRRLRFIASATAGTDHVDVEWLDSLGIEFAHAAGCNARAVAEYVAVCVLEWLFASERLGPESLRTPPGKEVFGQWTAGVIGAGQAGSATGRLLGDLGFEIRAYDPPRERRDPSFRSCGWDEVLACDILSLHVPLVRDGSHPTLGMLNGEALQRTRASLVVQPSRGGTLDENALLSTGIDLACDVWENEPVFRDPTAARALIATPHIAGYSVEGKQRSSRMAADAFVRFLGQEERLGDPKRASGGRPGPDPSLTGASDGFPSAGGTPGAVPPGHETFGPVASGHEPEPEQILHTELMRHASDPIALLRAIHPYGAYDAALRQWIGAPAERKAREFARIRNTFPLRREFGSMTAPAEWLDRVPLLRTLGVGAAAGS